MEKLFIQILGVLSSQGLVAMERVTHDGTKIGACASGKSFRREARLREHLEAAREHVAAMGDPLSEETARERGARRAAAQRRVKQLEAAEKALSELMTAVKRVKAWTSRLPREWVSDGGFTCWENILAMEATGVDLFGSLGDHSGKAAAQMRRRGVCEAYYPEAFAYDAASNTYRCPAGQILVYEGREIRAGITRQSFRAEFDTCRACPHQGQCCPGNNCTRRRISRMVEDPIIAFREKMQTESAKQVYRTRSALAEFPNAWIKTKIGLRQFRVRGLLKVTAEAFWEAVAYNVQQWVRLCWKPALKV